MKSREQITPRTTQNAQGFRSISRKFTKGNLFRIPVLTRKTFDEIFYPLEKKLDLGRNTVADRLLGSSVAKYGRLALWIGIIGEAPGHVQGPLRCLGRTRDCSDVTPHKAYVTLGAGTVRMEGQSHWQ